MLFDFEVPALTSSKTSIGSFTAGLPRSLSIARSWRRICFVCSSVAVCLALKEVGCKCRPSPFACPSVRCRFPTCCISSADCLFSFCCCSSTILLIVVQSSPMIATISSLARSGYPETASTKRSLYSNDPSAASWTPQSCQLSTESFSHSCTRIAWFFLGSSVRVLANGSCHCNICRHILRISHIDGSFHLKPATRTSSMCN